MIAIELLVGLIVLITICIALRGLLGPSFLEYNIPDMDDEDSERLTYSSHIPLEALKAISAIYEEGGEKYGDVDNWKTKYKSPEAIAVRLGHAQTHLTKWIAGVETGEDDIAKVAWFCFMVIYMRERHGIELPRE